MFSSFGIAARSYTKVLMGKAFCCIGLYINSLVFPFHFFDDWFNFPNVWRQKQHSRFPYFWETLFLPFFQFNHCVIPNSVEEMKMHFFFFKPFNARCSQFSNFDLNSDMFPLAEKCSPMTSIHSCIKGQFKLSSLDNNR